MAPLRELGSVWRNKQRQMRKSWRINTQRLKDENMLECIGQVVLAANNVTDLEVGIVGAGCQVIRWRAVAAQQGEVLNIRGGFRLLAINAVGELDIANGL